MPRALSFGYRPEDGAEDSAAVEGEEGQEVEEADDDVGDGKVLKAQINEIRADVHGW